MIVLVPAYEPDARLVTLVSDLTVAAPHLSILVVDDGSGSDYQPVFDAVRALGAEVIGHPVNLGKGHSLKAGFRHILARHPGADVVCADSDGQHKVSDILRVADRVQQHAGAADAPVVLGARRFTGKVPLRSRLGNTIARQAFRLTTARSLRDTQTGLRAYPSALLAGLLTVPGERFEYELNTLLEASAARRPIDEIDIDTVYLDDNMSSHFRPVVDSVRVMGPLFVYAAISFGSFLIDLFALQLLVGATGSLGLGVVGARLLSGTVNFVFNRQVVFRARQPRRIRLDAAAYFFLAISLLAASYVGLTLLTQVGVPLLAAKVVTDVVLYVVSFHVQRQVIFARAGEPSDLSLRPPSRYPLPAAPGPGPSAAGAEASRFETSAMRR